MKLVGLAIALAQRFAAGVNFTMFQELLYHKKNLLLDFKKLLREQLLIRVPTFPYKHAMKRSAPILANILKSLYQNFSDHILEGLVFL